MSTIYDSHPEKIFTSWMQSIKKKNEYQTTPISIQVSAKLIIFAWSYATYQAHELKNRLGNINIVETTEQIFVNKLAQIGMALYCGFTDDDIFQGKSFVHLDPSSNDERYAINMTAYMNGKPITISGTKKFLYPIVNKHTASGQIFIYVDAVRMKSLQRTITKLNIINGNVKVTILGYATKTDIKQNQSQDMLLEYSNRHSTFVGLNLIRPIEKFAYASKPFPIPKYVEELQCYPDVEQKIKNNTTYINNAVETKPMTQIDYSALFDPIIK